MINKLSYLLFFLFLSLCQKSVLAIEIIEASAYLNSASIGATSIQDTQISQSGGPFADQFGAEGLNVNFINNLNTDNFGTFGWIITNTGANLSDVSFLGFLNAEIDSILDDDFDFFNEYGSQANFVAGIGSGDSAADSWEIDEPGLLFGDIIDNLFTNSLDNFNNVPTGLEEDTSLALGFDIGNLLTNDILTVTFEISESDNGGLLHFDPDANSGFYFNGTSSVQAGTPTTVIEPNAFFLFIASLIGLCLSRGKKFI